MQERINPMMKSKIQDQLMFPSIPGSFLLDVFHAARHREYPVDNLLADFGLSFSSLKQSGVRISVNRYCAILKRLGNLTNDAFFGFLSKKIPKNALNVFCMGMVGSRNLNELIDYANQFYGLFDVDFDWTLKEETGIASISVNISAELPVDYRFILQSLLLMPVRLYGWVLGEEIEILNVNFPFSKNESDDRLDYLFSNNINYDAVDASICIDSRYLSLPVSCNRAQLIELISNKRQLFLLSRPRNKYSQQVRRILLNHKDEKWLDVDKVAQLMFSTPNKLWRKLNKEGTNFNNIREELKRDFALVLLENPDNTIEEIALSLHYNDTSAFRKAFRKWTGLKPSKYRNLVNLP